MLWKAGCLVAILGLVVSFSSCAFFGRAIKTATDAREVANLPIEPGTETVHSVWVDRGKGAQLRIEAKVLLVESEVDGGNPIVQLSMPVNYSVYQGEDGERLHAGAGELTGSVIVPAADSPHRDSFDPEVTLTHTSASFDPTGGPDATSRKRTGGGSEVPLSIRVEIGATDDDGSPVESARLYVIERPLEGAAGWTWSGVASFVLGPVIGTIGLILFIVGLIRRSKASNRPGPQGRPI